MSYPNQKKIKINKPKSYKDQFLQIGIEEWQEAFKRVKGNPSAFAMYLYLASNADGYEKYLSKEDFKKATGKSKSSYHRGIELLTENGYIYEDPSGHLNFATVPKEGIRIAVHNWEKDDAEMKQTDPKGETEESQICNTSCSDLNTEIDNIHNKEKQILTDNASSTDFSYLDSIVGGDGSFDGTWFDGIMPFFWGYNREKKIDGIATNTKFSKQEATYIVDNILENSDDEMAFDSPLSYLYGQVSNLGYFDNTYFDLQIIQFWDLSEAEQINMITKITRFTSEEAHFIVEHILEKDMDIYLRLKLLESNGFHTKEECSEQFRKYDLLNYGYGGM